MRPIWFATGGSVQCNMLGSIDRGQRVYVRAIKGLYGNRWRFMGILRQLGVLRAHTWREQAPLNAQYIAQYYRCY